MQNFNQNDAPILIVAGQSNAHGHGTQLPEKERITVPLKNVYALSCEKNQSYDISDVTWSGFVTHGMNLGETQDNTYCLAESFARLWQADIDAGKSLPPLYIIQISIGAQGIASYEKEGLNMWYPHRAPIIKKGELGDVDISLYPLATKIFSLAVKNLKSAGKNPKIIGLHFNQWETEAFTGGDSITYAEKNYAEFFKGFRDALSLECPIWLYEPLSRVYNNPPGVEALKKLFVKLCENSKQYKYMKTSENEGFDPARDDQGIFMEDCVHYSPDTHRWFAQKQYDDIFANSVEDK